MSENRRVGEEFSINFVDNSGAASTLLVRVAGSNAYAVQKPQQPPMNLNEPPKNTGGLSGKTGEPSLNTEQIPMNIDEPAVNPEQPLRVIGPPNPEQPSGVREPQVNPDQPPRSLGEPQKERKPPETTPKTPRTEPTKSTDELPRHLQPPGNPQEALTRISEPSKNISKKVEMPGTSLTQELPICSEPSKMACKEQEKAGTSSTTKRKGSSDEQHTSVHKQGKPRTSATQPPSTSHSEPLRNPSKELGKPGTSSTQEIPRNSESEPTKNASKEQEKPGTSLTLKRKNSNSEVQHSSVQDEPLGKASKYLEKLASLSAQEQHPSTNSSGLLRKLPSKELDKPDPSSTKNKLHPCDECDRTFFFKNSLEKHKLRHLDGGKRLMLRRMDRKMKDLHHALLKQKRQPTKKEEEDLYEQLKRNPYCNVCNQTYSSIKALRKHLKSRYHHDQRQDPDILRRDKNKERADQADKAAKRELSKECHPEFELATQKHSIGQFNCDVCRKKFCYEVSLDEHMMQHLIQEEIQCVGYKCWFCGEFYTALVKLDEFRLLRREVQRCGKCKIQLTVP